MKKKYQMSMEITLKVIGGKWKPIILCHLGNKSMRSGELRKLIPGVSQKVLTQQLRELENDKIIFREIHNEVPPKVIYSLTDEGKTLKDVLVSMSLWGERRALYENENGDSISIENQDHDGFLKF